MTPMVPVDEYRRRIVDSVSKSPPRPVKLDDALGRVAACDVYCHLDLPPFDTSAMDGFAVRAEDVAGASVRNPVSLRVVAEVRMGRTADVTVGEGLTIAVSTGGQVPSGADAVVPLEQCVVEGLTLSLHEPVRAGVNIRLAGEDSRRGELVVSAGHCLRPLDIAVLATAGAGTAMVVPAPRVGVISTGDELVSPGQDLQPGQIFDSNAYMLRALTANAGARPVDCGRVPDDPAKLMSALQQASHRVDLLVCSGGVSAGSNDPVRRAVAEGLQAECVNVAMKPGRPQAFGQVMGTPLIALPGNPIAALVSFEVFVRPALRKMRGLASEVRYAHAVVEEALCGAEDRVCYVPMRLCRAKRGWVVSLDGGRSRNGLAALRAAECLVRLLPGVSLEAGDYAEILMLDRQL